MLYPTLNQGIVFLYIFGAGFACGFLFDMARLFLIFCNQNKFVKHTLYFFSTAAACVTLYFVNLSTNFGVFRVYIIFTFTFALALQQICVGVPLNKLTDRIRAKYKQKKAEKSAKNNI